MSASRYSHRVVLSMALAAAAPMVPHSALAQELVLEEIIVTARKRVESLQETPVAVSAFSADALREQGYYLQMPPKLEPEMNYGE